jgi:LacI family transcriptional regulator
VTLGASLLRERVGLGIKIIMNQRRHVALLIETSNAYARGLIHGIVQYVRQHEPWSLFLPEQERGAAPPAWLAQWQGDGLIARIESPAIAALVRKTKLPVVDVSAARHFPGIPWVETDDAAMAQLAFDHLRERGFRRMAFCGEPYFNWSRWREEPFQKLCAEHNIEFHRYSARSRPEPRYSWNVEQRRLSRWLEELPRPVGIFACYDILARQVLDLCRELDRSVPEEIAVLGVDNDELLCNACSPSLSSLQPDAVRTGYEAARLLAEMFTGHVPAVEPRFIAPRGLVARQSTDITAIEDPLVARALRLIREQATSGAKVTDILRGVPLSRRAFEERCKALTGRTPHDFLLQYRLERAQQLLRETDLPLRVVAERAGFSHAEYLSEVFVRELKMRPGVFRERERQ